MQEIIIAAAILGLVAVYVMPFVTGLLSQFLPTSITQYLPSSTTPGFSTSTVIAAFVWGLIFFAILWIFAKVGVKAHAKALEV